MLAAGAAGSLSPGPADGFAGLLGERLDKRRSLAAVRAWWRAGLIFVAKPAITHEDSARWVARQRSR